MAHKDDWFRSGEWDAAAQELFESKLARSRAMRSQYLRIKGLGLKVAGHADAARTLLLRVLKDYPDNWVDVRPTQELLGDMARDAGNLDEAITWYRHVLHDYDDRPRMSCTSGATHLSLAQIYLDQGDPQAALESLDYLPVGELGMNDHIFRWNVLLADTCLALGELDEAKAAARRALVYLEAPDQFSRHPGVGRAVADAALVGRLEAIQRGEVSTARKRRFWQPKA